MIEISIPGRETLVLRHLALDYNGTIARDGRLIEALKPRLEALSRQLDICILTADTYGTVQAQCAALPVRVCTFPRAEAGPSKADIVRELGKGVVCLGNGFNDCAMFQLADLAIAVLDAEGMYAGLLPHADLLARSAEEALDLLLFPERIRADLRS